MKIFLILLISIKFSQSSDELNDLTADIFPDDFLFGAASSAYQVEGATNRDGRGSSIWDDLTDQSPHLIKDRSNGNMGPKSYEYFDEDVKALKDINMNFYRFSISWSRIMPNGDISSLNDKGIQYYNKLIDELLLNNIEPLITMYHFDLPSFLQQFGGFTNPVVIKYFEEYANILFEKFGDRVKNWVTFNEPVHHCVQGYGIGEMAPLINGNGVGEYLCVHHILLAHANVYKMYHRKFHASQNGKIGIALDSRFYIPKDRNNIEDVQAAHRGIQFKLGLFAHPIFSENGDYPEIVIETIRSQSKLEKRKWSRLPYMTTEMRNYILKSSDFLGVNYYTSRYAESRTRDINNSSFFNDMGVQDSIDPSWMRGLSNWLYSVPSGLRGLLNWIKTEYNNVEVWILENGFSDNELDDEKRTLYLSDHLKEILKAIRQDGCNVKRHTTWSLIDNFEWLAGYSENFGLYSVNFSSPERERKPRKSAYFLKKVIASREIPIF